MAKKAPNKDMMTISVLLIVIGLVADYWYMVPKLTAARTALTNNTAQLTGLQNDEDQLTKIKGTVTTAQDNLEKRGIDLSTVQSVLPQTEDMPSLYIQMESLMHADPNLTGTTYQLSDPVAATDGSVQIPVSVAATGSYSNLKALIVRLEHNIRPATFKTLSFNQAAVADGQAAGSAGLTLSATGFFRAQGLSEGYQLKSTSK